jgi:hypothetical protein
LEESVISGGFISLKEVKMKPLLRRPAVWLAGMLLFALFACNFPFSQPQPPPTSQLVSPTESLPLEDTPTPDRTNTPTVSINQVIAEANRDGVITIQAGGQRSSLLAPGTTLLNAGDGVDVNETGRAILRFADLLSVEVLRDGQITVNQLDISEQSVFITLIQNGGTLLNDFSPQQEIERRLTIKTEFATITATGTRFLVVREEDSPLEWVVALDAEEDDLYVTADGVSKPIPAGLARWVSPIGEPSVGIEAQMGQVSDWLESLQVGLQVQEIGANLMSFANLVLDMGPVQEIPPLGEAVNLQEVLMSFSEEGFFGISDCNQNGTNDIVGGGGRVIFDFRQLPNRVESVDLTVINFAQPGSGKLTIFDPGYQEIDTQEITVASGQGEVISLRTDRVVHFAELELTEGCLVGASLTPPDNAGRPGEPRPGGMDIVRITRIDLANSVYQVYFETYGFEATLPGQHVHFFFNTVAPEDAGSPGNGPWFLYATPSPFTGYTVADRPPNATQLCILVANPDHSVQPNSGNCVDLP